MLDLALSIEAMACVGGARSPYALDAVALDFTGGQYWSGGSQAASLAAMPGYSFTDSVDNTPNVDGSGFTSLVAESSKLVVGNTLTTDQDFVAWAVIDLGASAAHHDAFFSIGTAASDRISAYRVATTGVLNVEVVVASATAATVVGGTTASAARAVLLYRRRGGKNTCATKIGSTVVIGAEGGTTSFPAVNGFVDIGGFSAFNGNQPNAPMAGAFMRAGTFSDADITAILTAA